MIVMLSGGLLAVRMAYRVAPKAYTSETTDVPAPLYCSGGENPGVTPTAPSLVFSSSSAILAIPKSTKTALPEGVILIFCGLISRWIMGGSWACRYFIASHT